PFRQVLLKLHSRCNLSCDWCYMYEHADQSWRTRPRGMPADIVDAAARRVAEHVAQHRLPAIDVGMHGGEPLLAGAATITRVVQAVRSAVPAGTTVRFHIQTNGVLLDEKLLELLRELEITVGVSLDGGVVANDRHRLFPNGRSSFSA